MKRTLLAYSLPAALLLGGALPLAFVASFGLTEVLPMHGQAAFCAERGILAMLSISLSASYTSTQVACRSCLGRCTGSSCYEAIINVCKRIAAACNKRLVLQTGSPSSMQHFVQSTPPILRLSNCRKKISLDPAIDVMFNKKCRKRTVIGFNGLQSVWYFCNSAIQYKSNYFSNM